MRRFQNTRLAASGSQPELLGGWSGTTQEATSRQRPARRAVERRARRRCPRRATAGPAFHVTLLRPTLAVEMTERDGAQAHAATFTDAREDSDRRMRIARERGERGER